MGQKSETTVVTWYAKCREVCEKWIWINKPKSGGYGKIVKMGESHFAGTPKYGKGRRNGEDPWKDYHKWVCQVCWSNASRAHPHYTACLDIGIGWVPLFLTPEK